MVFGILKLGVTNVGIWGVKLFGIFGKYLGLEVYNFLFFLYEIQILYKTLDIGKQLKII